MEQYCIYMDTDLPFEDICSVVDTVALHGQYAGQVLIYKRLKSHPMEQDL